MQTVQMHQLLYRWAILMMQGIIRNLVTKVLSMHPDYVFDQQTMDLHLAAESTFLYP